MGLHHGTLKAELSNQRSYKKCLPKKPYSPFPEAVRESGNGGLVLQIKALPCEIGRVEVPQNAFWWVDAEFLPYNDAELVVTSTPYTPRLFHSWLPVKRVPHGRIIVFGVNQSRIKGYVLVGTESSMYPKVQSHPLGEAVAYAGKGELKVTSLSADELYIKLRDMDNRSHRFCAISPNGFCLAVLTHCMGNYYVEILNFGPMSLTVERKPQACHKLCPSFEASGTHNDHVECKWSPDGSHLAVSSSFGKFFLVGEDLSGSWVNVFPEGIHGVLSTAGSYDFDPSVRYSVIAAGSSQGVLAICQLDGDNHSSLIQQQVNTHEYINCVRYNQDGSSIAVSFQTCQVAVYSPKDLSLLHTIDMSEQCSHHMELYQNTHFPMIPRLSFSYDGRHLVTSSCDGYVRVWSVPRLLTLQEWCRKRILQNVPVALVRKLSLPQKVKQFLLSEFF